eukprot:1150295-Pelagomonas_calceolata.AAC.11
MGIWRDTGSIRLQDLAVGNSFCFQYHRDVTVKPSGYKLVGTLSRMGIKLTGVSRFRLRAHTLKVESA